MYLIQKSMSGKTIENKYGRFHYSDTYDENSHPKRFLDKSIQELAREYWNLGNRGVATVYSDGIAKGRAGRHAKPYEVGAFPPTMLSWQFAAITGAGIGDIYICGKICKGDMNLGGIENHSALSSNGGQATGAYGTYAVASDGIHAGAVASVAKFLAAANFESAGTTLIGNTIALGFQYVALTDVLIACTNTTELFVDAGVLSGHLFLLR